MTHQQHEWTVVEIGNEPVGAACECGQVRGFEPAPGIEFTYGSKVTFLHPFTGMPFSMTIRSVSLHQELGSHSAATIELSDSLEDLTFRAGEIIDKGPVEEVEPRTWEDLVRDR